MITKLDLKDKRILHELDIDAEISTSKLAKNVGLSQQVIDYRIKNLIKKDIIIGFFTIIDVAQVGYSPYRIQFRFKNISKEKKEEINQFFNQNQFVLWSAYVGGRWDYVVDFFAKSNKDFDNQLSGIIKKFKNSIQDYKVFTILFLNMYPHKYLPRLKKKISNIITIGPNINNKTIGKKDLDILELIKNNSRLPYLQIAKKLNIDRNTVKYRIKKLKQEGIIIGSKLYFRPSMLKLESYKIFFKIDNTNKEEENKLFSFFKEEKSTIYSLKMIGTWDIDIEVEVESRDELQNLIIKIRNLFPIIKDYEIMPIFKDTRIDFFPMNKGKNIVKK